MPLACKCAKDHKSHILSSVEDARFPNGMFGLCNFNFISKMTLQEKAMPFMRTSRGSRFIQAKKQHVCSFGLTHWNLECPKLSIILPLLLNLKISYSEYVYDGWSGVWLSRKTFLTGNKNCEAEVFTRSWNLGKWSAVGGIDGTMDLMG